MQRHPELTRRRLQAFKKQIESQFYSQNQPVALMRYAAPDRIPYAEAIKGTYEAVQLNDQLGPSWSTHWFKVDVEIPAAWAGQEVHLIWDSSSEACVWRDGQPMRGLSGTRDNREMRAHPFYVLADKAKGGETISLYIETAVNDLFGLNREDKYSRIGLLRQAEVAVFNRAAWDLYWDFTIVADSALRLAEPRAGQAMYAANTMANTILVDHPETWDTAREIAHEFLSAKNGDGQHIVTAVGHAHIDTAWLWPLAETRRKCVRTFSTVMELMDRYPDYRFVCSQAQQLAWIKEEQPRLFERIKARVKEGRFIIVGGAWVEPDCNIPSGEALVRQFVYGQQFYQQEFGITCEEFWLPDTFGYPAALPAIMQGSGIKYFLTQKLSWNQFNKPTFSTFIWEGLDGSQVLTHFPPADTYNGMGTVEEVMRSITNFKDHGRSQHSMYLYGWGDGGGGPTENMIESLGRMSDVDGLPKVVQRSPQEFFKDVEQEAGKLTRWVGELYFELHRGTYTTQAKNKLGNRRSEDLMHDVEFLWALKPEGYPKEAIDHLWRVLLLNQFHDILPGSSITQVYKDSALHYSEIATTGGQLREAALNALFPDATGSNVLAVNTLAVERREVVEVPLNIPNAQKASDGNALVVVDAPAMGYVVTQGGTSHSSVTLTESSDGFVFENEFIQATVSKDGLLTSFFDKGLGREMMQAPGNQFMLYEDRPLDWEAWDMDVYHLEKRRDLPAATSAAVLEQGPTRAAVKFTIAISEKSGIEQVVSLTAVGRVLEFANEVEWHEARQFLKVEFPVNIHASQAFFETQYGYVERPTHYNTSWDIARFEVSAHHWAALIEHDAGFALLNDCKYGYATQDNVLRLSLLRSPQDPDPVADMGHHAFRYGVMAFNGRVEEPVNEGLRFNSPILVRATAEVEGSQSFFSVSPSSVVLDTVKKAEDSNDVVLRLYEACGGRVTVQIQTAVPFSSAVRCDLMEREGEALAVDGTTVHIELTPFQVATIKLKQ